MVCGRPFKRWRNVLLRLVPCSKTFPPVMKRPQKELNCCVHEGGCTTIPHLRPSRD